jgi:hypothetical protein|tara:strand:+ start:550 stop:1038 length:489 start_codon:yes stop_codon:yes gene_type:complete
MQCVGNESDRAAVRSAQTDATWFVATELGLQSVLSRESDPDRSSDLKRCAETLRDAVSLDDEKALRSALRAAVRLLGHHMTAGLRSAVGALRGLLAAVRMIVSGPTVPDPEVALRRAVRLRSDLLSDTVTERRVLSLTAASAAPPPDLASTGSHRAFLSRAA